MGRRLKQAAVVFLVIFAVSQLIRPDRTNPPTDISRTIEARVGTASGLAAVLDRSCGDCHSAMTSRRFGRRRAGRTRRRQEVSR
jgi:hypothetical protein